MRTSVTTLAILLLGCAPMGETPGFRLGGSSAASPGDFSFVRDHEIIQLEARGAVLPRVVNIWGVSMDGALYVWGDPGSGWVERVADRPDAVRVRVGEDVYALRAAVVEDRGELERVVAAYQAKYGADLDAIFGRPATVDDFQRVYRLTPRG